MVIKWPSSVIFSCPGLKCPAINPTVPTIERIPPYKQHQCLGPFLSYQYAKSQRIEKAFQR